MHSPLPKNIRPAQPSDHKQVAPLIVQAMEDLAHTIANTTDTEKAIPLFAYFFQQPANQYSFKHTLVYTENDEVLGSITFYDGALLPSYRAPFLANISEKYKVENLEMDDETMAGEIYIDTLSVLPTNRARVLAKNCWPPL